LNDIRFEAEAKTVLFCVESGLVMRGRSLEATSVQALFHAADSSSLLWSAGDQPRAAQLRLFGLPFENKTLAAAVADTLAAARIGERRQIVFANAHVINTAAGDARYAQVLADADYRLSDGSGMAIAAKLCGLPFVANTNGTDFFPLLCREAAAEGVKIFLLGGAPKVAALAADTIAAAGFGAAIAGTHHGYFKPGSAEEDAAITAVNSSGASIVLVGMGVPTQDVWIANNKHRLTAPVAAGVGGLFDFFAGRVSRAPMKMRALGLEWCWRLLQEPGRLWQRYLVGNITFLSRALLEAGRQRGRPQVSWRATSPVAKSAG
jgi:exopolysaccharide biosynthesis WecB/TagA/CpsF family protein